MGFKFRKSKKFGPARFTLSKRGLSSSIGGKGFRIGVNSRGKVRTTVSIPGTGISFSSTLGGKKRRGRRRVSHSNSRPVYRDYSNQTTVSNELVVIILIGFVVLMIMIFFIAQIASAVTIGNKIKWIIALAVLLAVTGVIIYKCIVHKNDNADENIINEDSADFQKSSVKCSTQKSYQDFDTSKECELLNEMHKANNELDLHFSYIALQNFYYKYRADEKYLNLCIDYCLKDIALLPQANEIYIEQQIKTINNLMPYNSAQEKEYDRKELLRVQQYGFNGEIPAFKRMAIIEEKKKNYGQAVYYCNLAIDYYSKHNMPQLQAEFTERKNKLLAKKTK